MLRLGRFFFLYSKIIPKYGKFFSNNEVAYEYLIESIRNFPNQIQLTKKLKKAGFERIEVIDIMGGLHRFTYRKKMNVLKGKKILVIVTGGIACYKALDVIRKLIEKDVSVDYVLTKNAGEFVNVLSFESLLGKKVHLNLFSLDQEKNMSHIKLANKCDAILIVPCTANFLAKIANGIADDLATNIILASDAKKFIAPAMNTSMWNNKVVRKNIKYVEKIGFFILNPKSGKLACGSKGRGKLMDVDLIIDEISTTFFEQKLLGIKVLITTGPSIEKIDPIRYISNFSSGIQGYEIAKILSNFGAKTTLISGPTNLEPPRNVKLINVESGEEFLKSSIAQLPADVFISVAAISDWKSKQISKKKIKK